MSFHDRQLARQVILARKKKPLHRHLRAALRGVDVITLHPNSPDFRIGTVADDWLAVGEDLRQAMKQIELSD